MENDKNPIAIFVMAVLMGMVSYIALPPLQVVLSCILGAIMLAIAVSDMRAFIIPDRLSLPAIPMGLVATWLAAQPEAAAGLVLEHLLSALAGAAALYAIARTYATLRGHAGLGLGDVKLLAAGGAWIGWQGLPAVLLIASLSGLGFVAYLRLARGIEVGRTTALPFGVFLAPAIWIVWAAGQMVPPPYL